MSVWDRSELAYCSNVHPGETPEAVLAQISGVIRDVRERRGLEQMNSGLWLSAAAAAHFVQHDALVELRATLHRCGIRLVTINGFPYGGFHAERVKETVYQPDWSTEQRYAYTVNLARILAACLPDNEHEGSISTLPLGYAPTWSKNMQESADEQLIRLSLELAKLKQATGKHIRVCLEMEPGCVLESTRETIVWFTHQLPERARELGLSDAAIVEHLGICFDVCHQAVMFEDVTKSLLAFANNGIGIGKIQISSALECSNPQDPTAFNLLQQFSEPRYFHQVRTRTRNGIVVGDMDLSDTLEDNQFPREKAWRIHFHVPIQADRLLSNHISSTRNAIEDTLSVLAFRPELKPHIEVETYTWHVLPNALRPNDDGALCAGIVGELAWLETAMQQRHLLRNA